MRLFPTVVACAAALALASGPAPLPAQEIPSAYRFVETSQEVGVFLGYLEPGAGRFGFGPSSTFLLGGRWGIQVSGPLAFEVVADLRPGTRNVVDPRRADEVVTVGEADVLLGSAEGRLVLSLTGNRTWNGLTPYITLGGGLIFDLAGNDPEDEVLLPEDRFDFGTSFLGTAGVGSRLFLTDRFVLRGEGIFSLYQLDTPPGFSEAGLGFRAVEESEWVSGLVATLSLGYRF